MIDKIKRFWQLARGSWTVWLGAFIGSAETIRAALPGVTQYLPQWPWLLITQKWSLAILGFLICYTRVRRALAAQMPPGTST